MTDQQEHDFPAAWWPRPSIRMSRDFGELAGALAAAQAEMEHPKRNKRNPHFGSDYADLAEVIDAIKALNRHGIAVMGSTETTASDVRIKYLFAHKSNQWQEGTLDVPGAKRDAQGTGSALTYGRRYLLSLMCNIASEDDDDGNEATTPPVYQRREPTAQKPSPLAENKVISPAVVATLRRNAAAIGADLSACVRTATKGRTDHAPTVWTSEYEAVREAIADWKPQQPTLEDA